MHKDSHGERYTRLKSHEPYPQAGLYGIYRGLQGVDHVVLSRAVGIGRACYGAGGG